MKIVVFAPHPDDEIFGCGGSVLKWMEEGHDVHVIYVTDNRALIEWGIKEDQLLEDKAADYINLSGDELAEICLKEAEEVAGAFGLPEENSHFFKILDQDAENNIELGVSLSKEIIRNADRIVMPCDNNNHNDHQATHTIAKTAARELNLDVEYYVYCLYNVMKAPREKHLKINISDYNEKLYDIMKLYKTQLCLKDSRMGWKSLTRKRMERFGVFKLNEMNTFECF